MPNSISTAQIERFKREAKQLRRTSTVTHSQALDRIAEANGYDNWSLLMKHNDSSPTDHLARNREAIFRFTRTHDEMRQALRVIPAPRYGDLSRTDQALTQTEAICKKFTSARNAVDFAIDYVTCLLAVPRFKIYAATRVYIEMRRWLPYCALPINDETRILVNRLYKPVGQVTKDWAEYEEFQHLHLRLDNEQVQTYAHRNSSAGYLFNDGNSPWTSRADAEAYLQRLCPLREMLKA